MFVEALAEYHFMPHSVRNYVCPDRPALLNIASWSLKLLASEVFQEVLSYFQMFM